MSKPLFVSRSTVVAVSVAIAVVTLSQEATANMGVADLQPGHLFISEVLADPAKVSDTRGEWFEIKDTFLGSTTASR